MCLVVHSRLILCKPVDCHPPCSCVHGDPPGKHISMGCHALLPVIFPTQGSKPGLLGNFISWVTGEAHLDIYLKKTIIYKNTCTPMCIAAQFAIAWTCYQLKCLSTEEGIKKIWHICTVEYYSSIKKNETMLLTGTGMDLETAKVSEVSQKEKYKYIISFMWNLKKLYRWTCLQNRNRVTDIGKKLTIAKGGKTDEWIGRLGLTYPHCSV